MSLIGIIASQNYPRGITADVLVIAGGGSGGPGNGGGGGAGGLAFYSSQIFNTNTLHTITVGAGGAAVSWAGAGPSTRGLNGVNSSFGTLTAAVAGGGGGNFDNNGGNYANSGGSGGGNGGADSPGNGGQQPAVATGTAGQGNNGGLNTMNNSQNAGGGGGGAGAVGQNASGTQQAGNGGSGSSAYSSIGSATSTGQNVSGTYYYAGGGGGGSSGGSSFQGTGGAGGGGDGKFAPTVATAGLQNTGSGGGGGGNANTSGAGGSGIVIARYLSATQQAYGGTVVSSGGYYYHTFLSSSTFYTGLTLPVTGASLWLDASDSANITLSGSNVTTWSDKSGNGNHFTAPGGAEPLYVTNSQNGLPGIKFFPSSAIKYLTNTSLGNWSESLFTYFVVFNSTTTSSNYPALLGRNTAGALQIGGNNGGPAGLAISKIGTATQSTSLTYTGTTADVGVYKATAASSTSVTVQAYKNGTAASAVVTQGSLTSTGDKNSIGATTNGGGDSMAPNAYICEAILYPSSLSDADRNKVEGYLKAKWGTP